MKCAGWVGEENAAKKVDRYRVALPNLRAAFRKLNVAYEKKNRLARQRQAIELSTVTWSGREDSNLRRDNA